MSSSTSSAAAAEGGTVNEEVKNREESVEEVRPSSPFDRLPDEILVDILRAATDAEGWWRGRAALLALNRRLRSLAQPLWFSSYPFSSMECGIVRHPVYLALVKHLRYYASASGRPALVYEGLMLSSFANLVSLTIKHLKRLNLEPVYSYNLEDREFNIARAAPQLDGLTVQGPTTGVCQLLMPLPPLQHLRLYNIRDTEVYRYLPWSNLVSLALTVGILPISDSLRSLDAVNQSLEGALLPSPTESLPVLLPLRHFTLHDEVPTPEAVDRPFFSCFVHPTDFSRLLGNLSSTPTTTIRLHSPAAVYCPSTMPLFPSVISLLLEGEGMACLTSALDLASLSRQSSCLIDSFPNLLALSIGSIEWESVTAWQDEVRWARDLTSLLEDHPTLASFLDSLYRSSVLSFDFSPDFGEDKYRFVRVKRGEVFQVDRYPKVQTGDGYVFG